MLSGKWASLLYFTVPLLLQRRRQSRRGQRQQGRRGLLAVLLVLTLDQAQFAPQALAVAQQVAVVFQQPAVLLDESGCSLLLPLVLLQLTHQLLSKQHTASVTISASWTL